MQLDEPLSDAGRRSIARALRRPVGRYTYERASHLAGVPQRTMHHWARAGTFVPDFDHLHPKQWSYRDLVLVRLFVWLRQKGQTPDVASVRVAAVRERLALASIGALPELHADRHVMLVGDEDVDRLSGTHVLDGIGRFLDVFEFVSAIPEVPGQVWGPNLVRPSDWTSIVPSVMAGEPCVRDTRLPTANLWALRHQRGLSVEDIVELYPGVDEAQVGDAIRLEERLRPSLARAS